MTDRGVAEPVASRIARVVLGGIGIESPDPEQLRAATAWVLNTRSRANDALRAAFGDVSLPEDIKPSDLRPVRD
jgi:hypothetical protein